MTTNDTAKNGHGRHLRWAAGVAAALVLLLVFAAYLQPQMMMQMAQQVWSCF